MDQKIQSEAFKGGEITQSKMQEFLRQDLQNIQHLVYLLLSEPDIQQLISEKLFEVYTKRYANLLNKNEEQENGMAK